MAKKKIFKIAPKSNNAFKQNAAQDSADAADPSKNKKGGLVAWLNKSKNGKAALKSAAKTAS